MPPDKTDTPSRGRFNPVAWVKKNKVLAAILGGVGALIFFTQKGQSGGGGATIYDEEGNATDASAVQLVPVSQSPSEGTFENQGLEEMIEQARKEGAENLEELERQWDEEKRRFEEEIQAKGEQVLPDPPEPAEPPEPVEAAPPPPAEGITLHGRSFPAAVRVLTKRNGKDQRGNYIEYVLQFPSFTQRWHYYTEKPTGWKKVGDSRDSGGGGGAAPSQPQCAHTGEIRKNRNEMNRLQGEINGLQNHIQQLTNVIQQHPNAKKRPQWERERNQDRANIEHKRAKVQQLSNRNNQLRQQPGCGNV